MAKKLEDVRELKPVIAAAVEEPTEGVDVEKLKRLISPENRQAVIKTIDELLSKCNYDLYESILGFTDLINSIFIAIMADTMKTKEEKDASEERINTSRHALSAILNERRNNFIAEDVIVLLSLVSEAVVMTVSEEIARIEKKA